MLVFPSLEKIMNNITIAQKIIKQLSGFFPYKNILIGGSLGLELKIPIFKQDNNSDIDIFILIPRIERWALLHILKAIDIDIEDDVNLLKVDFPNYKLEGQWARIKARKLETDVDLIFLESDQNTLIDNTAADISKFYYTLEVYRPKITPFLVNNIKSEKAYARIISGKCFIDSKKATHDHIKKMERKCEQFGLKSKLFLSDLELNSNIFNINNLLEGAAG